MRLIALALCLFPLFVARELQAADAALPAAIASAVDRQVARLHSPDPAERIAAAREVRMMGEEAAAAAPALADLLADPTKVTMGREAAPTMVGAEAAWALSELGPAGIDALLAALRDPRPPVRVVAAGALGGPKKDRRAIPPLIELMRDADPAVRAAAVNSLGDFYLDAAMGAPGLEPNDPRVEAALRSALADPVWRVRESAALGFMFRKDAAAFGVLVAGLRDQDPAIRADAANSLSLFGDQQAVEPLLSALKDTDPSVRGAAAVAAGRLKGRLSGLKQPEPWNPKAKRWQDPDPRVVQALTTLLRDRSPEVRAQAAKALGETRNPRALQPLITATKDTNPNVAAEAYSALGWLGSSRAVPALVSGLKRPDARLRVMAAQGLSTLRLGLHDDPAFRTALKPLLAALQDTDPGVRASVAMVLGELRDRRALPPLLGRLQRDPDPEVRAGAAFALGEIGGAETVGPLLAALKDSSAEVRAAAAGALGEFAPTTGEAGAQVTAALARALQDPDPEVRSRAALSLAPRKDPRATEALKAALQDPDRWVREHAAEALALLGVPEATAPTLDNPSPHVRSRAADTLIRSGGPKAVEAFLTALQDPDQEVRTSALVAAFNLERGTYLKDSRLVGPLIGALKDPSPTVRMWAVAGLVLQRDARAIEPLITALATGEPELKNSIPGALCFLTGQDFGEDATAWQRWWQENKDKPVHPPGEGR